MGTHDVPGADELLAELEAIERACIAELVADGATAEQAAAQLDAFFRELAEAFDRAPLLGAPMEDNPGAVPAQKSPRGAGWR